MYMYVMPLPLHPPPPPLVMEILWGWVKKMAIGPFVVKRKLTMHTHVRWPYLTHAHTLNIHASTSVSPLDHRPGDQPVRGSVGSGGKVPGA